MADSLYRTHVYLKSKTAIRTTDTRYFVYPSIATAALGIGPGDLINDLKSFGFLFETLCVRDLRIYSQLLGATVYHYRDKNGLECDAVVHMPNGKYGLIEIKLGGEKFMEDACKTLTEVSVKIDTEKMNAPSFLMVLTATGALPEHSLTGAKTAYWLSPLQPWVSNPLLCFAQNQPIFCRPGHRLLRGHRRLQSPAHIAPAPASGHGSQ